MGGFLREARSFFFMPMRKPDCLFYGICLTAGGRLNRSFDCQKCGLYEPGPFLSSVDDLLGCLRLVMRLYYPVEYSNLVCQGGRGWRRKLLGAFLRSCTRDRHFVGDGPI